MSDIKGSRWWMNSLSQVSRAQARVMGYLADGMHISRDPHSLKMWIVHEPYRVSREVARVQRKTIESLQEKAIIKVLPDPENAYRNRWMLNVSEAAGQP